MTSATPAGNPDQMTDAKQRIVGYYQPIFSWLHKVYHRRLGEQLDRRLEFRRQNFFPNLPIGKEFYGDDAWQPCNSYLKAIEAELAEILSRHSVFFWIHLYRRIGVYLSSGLGPKTDANTLGLVRQIAELSISKYGDLNRSDDTAKASNVRAKDVLGGHYQRLLMRWNKHEFPSFFRELQKSDQFVLTRFEYRDFFNIYYVEALAYEYWRTTALMRAIGKETGFSYDGSAEWVTNHGPAGISSLIDSYDGRIAGQHFNSVLAGTWFREHGAAEIGSRVATPDYNIQQTDGRSELARFGIKVAEAFTPNFTLGAVDFAVFHRSNAFMAAPFADVYGCSFDAYMLALWGVCALTTQCVPFLLRQAEKGEDVDINDQNVWQLHSLIQRGYGIQPSDNELLAESIIEYAGSTQLPFSGASKSDVVRALEHLELAADKRNKIALWTSGRRFPLIPIKEDRLVDLQGIPYLLHTLFVGVQHRHLDRGSVFEKAFVRALESEGYEIPRTGEIKAIDGSKREIDASVRIGSTLVLFECRSIERPLDYEIGNIRTFRKRRDFLEEKLDQVLTLADFIKANPQGRNYDFSWAREVIPFVVSPFVEWIWERSTRLWHDHQTPRILQADEALNFIGRLSKQ